MAQGAQSMETGGHNQEKLHIFVNEHRFAERDGVRREMTGSEIAALAGVPDDIAVVHEDSPQKREIGLHERIRVEDGGHFLVTRKKAHLHIFVNRRKFEEGDGVRHEMTGAQIAGLVGVPEDNAVIREESPEKRDIGVQEKIHVKDGAHFLVTRKIVEGGYVN
jgi:multiubiquitin